jgi:hypothetical protein
MGKVSEKVKEEFLAMIPPTIFFFFTLGLVAVVRMLMTKGTGLPVSTPIQVAVGALILGRSSSKPRASFFLRGMHLA